MNIKQEFSTVKELVMHVLENCPETRNSDNKLYIECARKLGAVSLEDLENISLNLVSVHKIRQRIQNVEMKFRPTEDVQQVRSERKKQIKEWMVS